MNVTDLMPVDLMPADLWVKEMWSRLKPGDTVQYLGRRGQVNGIVRLKGEPTLSGTLVVSPPIFPMIQRTITWADVLSVSFTAERTVEERAQLTR